MSFLKDLWLFYLVLLLVYMHYDSLKVGNALSSKPKMDIACCPYKIPKGWLKKLIQNLNNKLR